MMNGVLSHDSAMYGYTGPRTTWANEMNFVLKYAPGAGSIALVVDQNNCTLKSVTDFYAQKDNVG